MTGLPALSSRLPLIVHVVFRFDYGGLENGLVNLINHMPAQRFRHCVVALTEATEFRSRLCNPDVEVYALGKQPGKNPRVYLQLQRLLRRLKPAIVHTRNIGTIDCVLFGRLAGVKVCLHGEHGWDTHDPEGTSRKYRLIRRLMNPFVTRFVTVSLELREWLTQTVGIRAGKVVRICNGVDTARFHPEPAGERRHPEITTRFGEHTVIVGSVLRFNAIKDPMNLIEAFVNAHRRATRNGIRLGLAMVGDGPLRLAALDYLTAAGIAGNAWLPGSRDDVPLLMRSFGVFVLPSRREGISNTLLEAMATGLPVIATETGGNRELLRDGQDGTLVPTENPQALAEAILGYANDVAMRRNHGRAARQRAVAEYSLGAMVKGYCRVYEDVLARVGS